MNSKPVLAKDRKANFYCKFCNVFSSISNLPISGQVFIVYLLLLLPFHATACRTPSKELPGQGVQQEGDPQGAAQGPAVRGDRAQELVNTIKAELS